MVPSIFEDIGLKITDAMLMYIDNVRAQMIPINQLFILVTEIFYVFRWGSCWKVIKATDNNSDAFTKALGRRLKKYKS